MLEITPESERKKGKKKQRERERTTSSSRPFTTWIKRKGFSHTLLPVGMESLSQSHNLHNGNLEGIYNHIYTMEEEMRLLIP